jgi:hypothetical protein
LGVIERKGVFKRRQQFLFGLRFVAPIFQESILLPCNLLRYWAQKRKFWHLSILCDLHNKTHWNFPTTKSNFNDMFALVFVALIASATAANPVAPNLPPQFSMGFVQLITQNGQQLPSLNGKKHSKIT